ncbi:hypothetical protein ACET3Z_005042 [Daucus carota]
MYTPFSSHCLGAAGGLEAIAVLKAITTGWLHPSINQYNSEPSVEFDTVPNQKQQHEVNVCISNSFGFGGHKPVLDQNFSYLGMSSTSASYTSATASAEQHWLSGTVFILIGCIAWSLFFVLQSITLKKYPAELSLAFLICLMGAILSTAVTSVAEAHDPNVWAVGWNSKLLAPAYAGVVSSGLTNL